MRTMILLLLGMVIGAAALSAVWATTGGTAGTVDVRIVVERLEDGRVEVGLQQREVSGAWGETEKPTRRFLASDEEAGLARYSSEIVVNTDSRHELVANNYGAYLVESGEEIANIFSEYFGESADQDLPKMLCIEDLNDPGIGQLCGGLESGYGGKVERLSVSDYDEFRTQIETTFREDDDLGGYFATSVPLADIIDETMEANDTWVVGSYWIELIDPHLPAPDDLHCIISHGGGEDLFWGLASESSVAAAGALGIDVRTEVYAVAAEQAEAIRRCVADGAVSIATTLAEPEILKPAVQEAINAGTHVISFNSGAEVAADVGTALHIGLDDREGGRIAGAEFNERGIQGNALCIIHEPNNVGLHDRCNGLEETFDGTVERWSPTSDETVIEELDARIGEGDVDAALALSSDTGIAVRIVVFLSDADVPAATFGWSRLIGELVAEGRMMFAIFDHPELQPYLAAVGSLIVERLRIDPEGYFNSTQLLIQANGHRCRGDASPARLVDRLANTAIGPARAGAAMVAVPAFGPDIRNGASGVSTS